MWNKLIEKLLLLILPAVTPALKEMLCKFIEDFKVKAKATPNPMDDVMAEILDAILCPK